MNVKKALVGTVVAGTLVGGLLLWEGRPALDSVQGIVENLLDHIGFLDGRIADLEGQIGMPNPDWEIDEDGNVVGPDGEVVDPDLMPDGLLAELQRANLDAQNHLITVERMVRDAGLEDLLD